jgi:hypothetical protein
MSEAIVFSFFSPIDTQRKDPMNANIAEKMLTREYVDGNHVHHDQVSEFDIARAQAVAITSIAQLVPPLLATLQGIEHHLDRLAGTSESVEYRRLDTEMREKGGPTL